MEETAGSEPEVSVQDQIASFVKHVEKKQLNPYFKGCEFYEEDIEMDENRIDVITVNCPPFPNRSIGFSMNDTPQNWESTIDLCENVLIHEFEHDDGTITRTYAAWGEMGSNSIAF